ncbi:MAG: hypothetical protein ACTSRG_13060 [Candidatus Helarchaeota archaeon]
MSDITNNALKNLMPDGPTWEGKDTGLIKEQIAGMAVQMKRDRQDGKNILNDFFPIDTNLLVEWEYAFALPFNSELTDEQRRARLVAAWNKEAVASYSLINKDYARSGIPVIARPLEETEDPRLITDYDQIFVNGSMGELFLNYIGACGIMHCGDIEESSFCGTFEGTVEVPKSVTIPDDNRYWPLIFVLEDEGGGKAQIPGELKQAYEFLTWKNKPLFMWGISRVDYV